MKRTNTQTISDILKDFFQENPAVEEKLAESRLINSWESILGSTVLRYTENLYIKNKTLYVRISSAILRNELSLCRSDLIRKLNDAAGMDVINNMIITG